MAITEFERLDAGRDFVQVVLVVFASDPSQNLKIPTLPMFRASTRVTSH